MSDPNLPNEVFADTCVLLNFVQREWEHDQASELFQHDAIDIIISESVYEEFESVCERREDIYPDFLDFLLEEDGELEDYDPASRRVYFDSNDVSHVRSIQYELADVDDRREVQRRLRKFIRAARARIDHLESKFDGEVVDVYPPMELRFALDKLIDHSADVRVITDAAAWTANGGSSTLVTLDDEDILDRADEINDTIRDEMDDHWTLVISVPQTVIESETHSSSTEHPQET